MVAATSVAIDDGLFAVAGPYAAAGARHRQPGKTLLRTDRCYVYIRTTGRPRTALAFSVTTCLDMFTMLRGSGRDGASGQAAAGDGRADLLSAGTPATAPGRHGGYGVAFFPAEKRRHLSMGIGGLRLPEDRRTMARLRFRSRRWMPQRCRAHSKAAHARAGWRLRTSRPRRMPEAVAARPAGLRTYMPACRDDSWRERRSTPRLLDSDAGGNHMERLTALRTRRWRCAPVARRRGANPCRDGCPESRGSIRRDAAYRTRIAGCSRIVAGGGLGGGDVRARCGVSTRGPGTDCPGSPRRPRLGGRRPFSGHSRHAADCRGLEKGREC